MITIAGESTDTTATEIETAGITDDLGRGRRATLPAAAADE